MDGNIELFVEPGKVYSWEQFRSEKPPYSIALDGFVNDSTKRDPRGPYANFDHHSGADRLATRSTSEQVHMEINLGLFEAFRKRGIPTANVYVNDPDEDTCLAVWLLRNGELVRNHANPKVNRLVYCEDRLDCTAGAYPFGEIKMRRKMAWIFESYNMARFEGHLHTLGESGVRAIIDSVNARITEHVINEGGEIPLKGQYEKIGGGPGWVFVRETGPASRMAMFRDGITAFAALVEEEPDGSYIYVLGRKSVWIPFDLERIYACLNEGESKIVGENNCWGGSNTIGGSPRETGSKLKPNDLQKIINEELSRY